MRKTYNNLRIALVFLANIAITGGAKNLMDEMGNPVQNIQKEAKASMEEKLNEELCNLFIEKRNYHELKVIFKLFKLGTRTKDQKNPEQFFIGDQPSDGWFSEDLAKKFDEAKEAFIDSLMRNILANENSDGLLTEDRFYEWLSETPNSATKYFFIGDYNDSKYSDELFNENQENPEQFFIGDQPSDGLPSEDQSREWLAEDQKKILSEKLEQGKEILEQVKEQAKEMLEQVKESFMNFFRKRVSANDGSASSENSEIATTATEKQSLSMPNTPISESTQTGNSSPSSSSGLDNNSPVNNVSVGSNALTPSKRAIMPGVVQDMVRAINPNAEPVRPTTENGIGRETYILPKP